MMDRVNPVYIPRNHLLEEALTAATMSLYKEHNANPAMGCLPTLLQFPILIGLFYALLHLGQSPNLVHGAFSAAQSACGGNHPQKFSEWISKCYAVPHSAGILSADRVYLLYHHTFLWLSNGLGKPDPLKILPLLAGATQWIQSRMMLTHSNDQQQQMMNTMMNFMPLIIVVFAMQYASGLSLYWVTSTVIGIAIQARITGWGLLPRPSTLFGRWRGSVMTPSRAFTPNTANKPRAPKPAPVQETAPEVQAQVINDSNGADTTQNGHSLEPASTGGQPPSGPAGARPARKRSNRARGGGRKGGRRG
ncbi:MAG: hypothetical protein PVSMB7_24420 [Chloroflexota bacterium]